MPRALSRILLEITAVRVEQLNDCSVADALAEGIAPELDGWTDYSNPSCQMCVNPVDSYRTLWDSINGAGAWEANPGCGWWNLGGSDDEIKNHARQEQ